MRIDRRIVVVGAALVLGCGLTPAVTAADPVAAPSNPVPTATLPTGDRVSVVGGTRPAVSIRPAPGRERMVFHEYATGDRLYVVPQDAVGRIGTAASTRGFDVSRLLAPNRGAAGGIAGPRAGTPPGDSVVLTTELRDPTGALTGDYSVAIVGLDDGQVRFPYDPDGSLTVTLPKGRYFVDSVVNTTASDGTRRLNVLPHPNVRLDRDTTLEVPAGAARPIRVTPPDRDAAPLLGNVGFNVVTANGTADVSLLTTDVNTVSIAQLGAPLPADVLTTMVNSQWATPGGDFYGLAWFPRGVVPTGFTRTVTRDELATVRVDLGTQIPGDIGERYAVPDSVSADVLAAAAPVDLPLPTVRTEFYNTDGVQWNLVLFQFDPAQFPNARVSFQGGQHVFRPGGHYRLSVNHAPYGPAFSAVQLPWACRCADTIDFTLPLVGDAAGNSGESTVDTLSIKLFRDGQLIGRAQDDYAATFPVPPGPAGYRLTADLTRPAPFTTSTRISAAWTFRSGHAAEDVTLPLSAIIFSPVLDRTGTAPAGRPFLVPVAVQPQSGRLETPRQLSVDVSYDEGGTWRPAETVDNRAVLLHHPADATSVSLRASATDRDGNTVTETLIRAYALAPR